MGKSRISSEKTRFFQKKLTFSGIFLGDIAENV